MVKIYGLVCPFSGEIRYIGKTSRKLQIRLVAHLAESRRTRHSHKHRWIARLDDAGQKPAMWLLEDVDPADRWQDRERLWIKRAKDMGLDLTNQTAGGEGLDLIDPVAIESYRKSQSVASKKARKNNPKIAEALAEAGRRSWAENKQARIEASRAGWTIEAKKAHADKMAIIRKTPEFKAAKVKGQKQAWKDSRPLFMAAFANPECKLKQSESKKRTWADPGSRERLMNRWTPEARAKQVEALRERRAKIQAAMTPEVRARQAAKLKQTWAKRKAAGFRNLGMTP